MHHARRPSSRQLPGVFSLPDGAGKVRCPCPVVRRVKARPEGTFTPIDVYDVRLADLSQVDLDFPAHHNAALLVMQGNASVNSAGDVAARRLRRCSNDGEQVHLEAERGERGCSCWAARPIDEPVDRLAIWPVRDEHG